MSRSGGAVGAGEIPKGAIGWVMAALGLLGVAVIVLAIVLRLATVTVSDVHTKTASTTSSTATATASASTQPSTQVVSSDSTVTTSQTLSDATLATLLAIGVLLCIAAATFPRITKLALPGGAEIDMTALAEQTAQHVAAAVARRADDFNALSAADATAKVSAALASATNRARLVAVAAPRAPGGPWQPGAAAFQVDPAALDGIADDAVDRALRT